MSAPDLDAFFRQWHSSLLDASALFHSTHSVWADECEIRATRLAKQSSRFAEIHGTPRIDTRQPGPPVAVEVAGSRESVRIYIELNSVRQDIENRVREAQEAYEAEGRRWAPRGDMNEFFSEVRSLLTSTERICSKLYQARGDMLRRELYVVVPTTYREQMRLHIKSADNTPISPIVSDIALRLYRGGVPGDYAGAVSDWSNVRQRVQSREVAERVISLYKAGIAPELAGAML